MDWKEMLGRLKEDPMLPAGEEPAVEETSSAPAAADTLHVIVDKKGRKGKVATIVEGFTSDGDTVAGVAAMLKKKLGVGGSARGGEILIQGNLADKVREILTAEGYKVK